MTQPKSKQKLTLESWGTSALIMGPYSLKASFNCCQVTLQGMFFTIILYPIKNNSNRLSYTPTFSIIGMISSFMSSVLIGTRTSGSTSPRIPSMVARRSRSAARSTSRLRLRLLLRWLIRSLRLRHLIVSLRQLWIILPPINSNHNAIPPASKSISRPDLSHSTPLSPSTHLLLCQTPQYFFFKHFE